MLRHGISPIQLSLIAGAPVQVISDHYTNLTKGDAYDAMLKVLGAQTVSRSSRYWSDAGQGHDTGVPTPWRRCRAIRLVSSVPNS